MDSHRARKAVLILGGVVLLAVIAAWAVYVTQALGGMPLSGWIAMILGAAFAIAVGVGLMALVFYSSRKGYDEPPRRE